MRYNKAACMMRESKEATAAMNRTEELCARLCLLTHIASEENMPSPLSRRTVRALAQSSGLDALMQGKFDESRVQMIRAAGLLARAPAALEQLSAYEAQGYSALLEKDSDWPVKLRKLGADTPQVLFARGNQALLSGPAVAVAGSRRIACETEEKADRIGRILAKAGITIVTGGADGVDRAVQCAALAAGGSVIVVPAMPASDILWMPGVKRALKEGRMLILCETPPDEPFSAQKALTRNHTIYALGDLAMVIASRKNIGGSWAGARASLKNGWSPVYVLDEEGPDFAGNQALLSLGALRLQIDAGEQLEDLILEGMGRETLARFGLFFTPRAEHPTQVRMEEVFGRAL